jgi:importin subunit beta-1
LLLETLLKQEEDQDQDDNAWNISLSGGTCPGLISRTVGDAVVPLVMPFVETNITKPDWHCRGAASFAFGSILEGPSVGKLAPLVQAGLDFLLNTMNDANSQVKDTTAWTLERVFELLHSPAGINSIINGSNLPRINSIIKPRRCCHAIIWLVVLCCPASPCWLGTGTCLLLAANETLSAAQNPLTLAKRIRKL